MKIIFLFSLAFLLFAGCKKEQTAKIDIYMLKSFTLSADQSTTPAHLTITDAVLADAPLVADRDIDYYVKSATTFRVKKDIKAVIKNFESDKAFAVTVDNRPVYFGLFYPANLSSIAFGLATVEPIFYNGKDMQIKFAILDGNTFQQLDKRNDNLLLNALGASRRLR